MTQKTKMVNIASVGASPSYVKETDWLWCLKCERFFQAKDLETSSTGNSCGCPTKKCDGAGLNLDIYAWDDWSTNGTGGRLPHWPKDVSELATGQKCKIKN